MLIEQAYIEIMEKLKNGERALMETNQILDLDLNQNLDKLFSLKSYKTSEIDSFNKILCVLTYQIKGNFKLGTKVLDIALSIENLPFETAIYCLNTLSKHVIEYCQLKGNKYPTELYEVLKKYLKSENAELLEWTLRTIDQIGMKSIVLKNEILNVRPHFFKGLNPHHKNSRAIIEMLEKRWSIFNE
ncbi:MAG: hypothetical protein H6622_09070 [Halobacteriovoraceae bacterium]|nr:hypothetical protein [Halobacteriovoraceae bacterium]